MLLKVEKLNFRNYRLPRQWLVLAVLAGLLAGLGAARYGTVVGNGLLTVLLILSPLLILRRRWGLLLALAVGCVIGIWRGQAVYSQLRLYQAYEREKAAVLGTVANDPVYHDSGQLEFIIDRVSLEGKRVPGRLSVRGYVGALSIRRGDTVRAFGRLNPAFGGRQGSMSYADIAVVRPGASWLESLRRRFFAGVYSALPEPQGSLGLGFLAGTRSLLPDSLSLELRRVGLTHIVAVSGYNLTILVRIARRLGMRFSKRLAALLAAGLVAGFILVAGPSPSISRAAVVTALAVGAWYYGRKISPLTLLLGSSAATAMVNPLFLWSDLGWWLSFLAFFGILIVAPLLKSRLFGGRRLSAPAQIVLESASAQLMTLPLIMAVFGELSVISLLANVIILPLIPLAMLFTFAAGLAGMLLPQLAGWLSWPATVLLSFVTETVSLLSRPGWAFVERSLAPLSAGLIYAAVTVICLILLRELKRRGTPVFTETVIE
jgi:competence protein ComEC